MNMNLKNAERWSGEPSQHPANVTFDKLVFGEGINPHSYLGEINPPIGTLVSWTVRAIERIGEDANIPATEAKQALISAVRGLSTKPDVDNSELVKAAFEVAERLDEMEYEKRWASVEGEEHFDQRVFEELNEVQSYLVRSLSGNHSHQATLCALAEGLDGLSNTEEESRPTSHRLRVVQTALQNCNSLEALTLIVEAPQILCESKAINGKTQAPSILTYKLIPARFREAAVSSEEQRQLKEFLETCFSAVTESGGTEITSFLKSNLEKAGPSSTLAKTLVDSLRSEVLVKDFGESVIAVLKELEEGQSPAASAWQKLRYEVISDIFSQGKESQPLTELLIKTSERPYEQRYLLRANEQYQERAARGELYGRQFVGSALLMAQYANKVEPKSHHLEHLIGALNLTDYGPGHVDGFQKLAPQLIATHPEAVLRGLKKAVERQFRDWSPEQGASVWSVPINLAMVFKSPAVSESPERQTELEKILRSFPPLVAYHNERDPNHRAKEPYMRQITELTELAYDTKSHHLIRYLLSTPDFIIDEVSKLRKFRQDGFTSGRRTLIDRDEEEAVRSLVDSLHPERERQADRIALWIPQSRDQERKEMAIRSHVAKNGRNYVSAVHALATLAHEHKFWVLEAIHSTFSSGKYSQEKFHLLRELHRRGGLTKEEYRKSVRSIPNQLGLRFRAWVKDVRDALISE